MWLGLLGFHMFGGRMLYTCYHLFRHMQDMTVRLGRPIPRQVPTNVHGDVLQPVLVWQLLQCVPLECW